MPVTPSFEARIIAKGNGKPEDPNRSNNINHTNSQSSETTNNNSEAIVPPEDIGSDLATTKNPASKFLLLLNRLIGELISSGGELKDQVTLDELKYVIFHQASKIVIENLIRKLDIPLNKIYKNYDRFGNTVSSTIPLCLYELRKKGMISKGDKILICGFGVGLSIASTILEV